MAETGLGELVAVGEQLFVVKLFITAVHCLWIYDYFITFGDEVEYAWNGRRSWVFALFIGNRYAPVPYIIWSSAITYGYTDSFCNATKSLGAVHSTVVTVLAEITVGLRVYAVTERNKWIGGALSSLILGQLTFGIYMVVAAAENPMLRPPEINLDPFKFCVYEMPKLGDLVFVNIAVAFDILAFLIVFIVARKPGHHRYPGIPSILSVILRHATKYFLLIFLLQILYDLFIFFASESIALFPGLASTVLVPLMASRLMLSLKKASLEHTRAWSFSTATNLNRGLPTDRTMRFASQVPGRTRDVPGTLPSPAIVEEGVELESVSRSFRKVGFPQFN